ncbi:MAG TPA: hypothetical protein VEJ18_15475 [Planctomycetota bacterium]|nr:hypothetical protein [Planctomycetota bacterium]
MTLVLDLFLKRPFISAAVAGLLPPIALAFALPGVHLDRGMGLVIVGGSVAFSGVPALLVAVWLVNHGGRGPVSR